MRSKEGIMTRVERMRSYLKREYDVTISDLATLGSIIALGILLTQFNDLFL